MKDSKLALTVYDKEKRRLVSGLAVCAGTAIGTVLAWVGVPAGSVVMLPLLGLMIMNAVYARRDARSAARS